MNRGEAALGEPCGCAGDLRRRAGGSSHRAHELGLTREGLAEGSAPRERHHRRRSRQRLSNRSWPQKRIRRHHVRRHALSRLGGSLDFLLPHERKLTTIACAWLRACSGHSSRAMVDDLCGRHHHLAGLHGKVDPEQERVGKRITGCASFHWCCPLA